MSSRRIIEAYINVEARTWCASDGSYIPPRSIPNVAQDHVLFRLHLVNNDGTIYNRLTETNTFTFGLLYGTTLLALGADVNQEADWDDLDVTEGRICFNIETNTVEMATLLVGQMLEHITFTIQVKSGSAYVDNYVLPMVANNAQTSEFVPTPVVGTTTGTVNVASDVFSITVGATVPAGVTPLCTVLAPLGDTNNIGIANVQVAADNSSFTVYFTATIPTAGFKLFYALITA
jgi:hypothetical protein